MEKIKEVVYGLVPFCMMILIGAWKLAKALLVVWAALAGPAMLWGAANDEWLDESIGGHAMLLFSVWLTSVIYAKPAKRRPAREVVRCLGRGAGLTALLLAGAAMINMVIPGTFALSWPVPQDLRLHITPVAAVLAVIVLHFAPFWARCSRQD